MPRSGPRPYECIRRAWHSDRHQPVRGSLIKEIFRVVNEIHSSVTKKNKEWQEKLPVVVLKAEEIMYSKANSEAEYTDLKTLWDRANDAINTIIRRDESTETGAEFLQPCIEAALHLGCVARRASRSQRYSNPRCYLSPITSDVHSDSIVEKGIQKDSASNSQHLHRCLNMKPITMNATHLGAKANFKFTSASKNVPPCSPWDTQPTTKFSSYPFYYGKCPGTKEVEHGYGKPDSNPLEPTPTKISVIPNLLASEDKSDGNAQIDTRDYPIQSPYTLGCDLSLRLGPNSSQCPSSEINLPKQVGAQEGTKSPHLDKDLSSFATGNEHAPIDSCLSPWSYKCEFMNLESTSKKRKADFIQPTEDIKLCRQPELPFMGNRGL